MDKKKTRDFLKKPWANPEWRWENPSDPEICTEGIEKTPKELKVGTEGSKETLRYPEAGAEGKGVTLKTPEDFLIKNMKLLQ